MSPTSADLKLIDDLVAVTGLSRSETIELVGTVAKTMLRIVSSGAIRSISPVSIAIALGIMAEITIATAVEETGQTELRKKCLAAIEILRANADATWKTWIKKVQN